MLALDRALPDPDYEGFGWARADALTLAGSHGPRRRITDALVVAVHAADDGAALPDDVELDFAIDGRLVRVAASAFLAAWLPRLPRAAAIVLAMCNPHRAVLARPPGGGAPIHYAAGDVVAWLDPGDRVRLAAEAWRTLGDVTDLVRRPGTAISDEDKQTYAGLYVLKKLDLKPEDGGVPLPVVLPSDLAPLDELLQQLAVEDRVAINRKTGQWNLTKQGLAYLGEHIDEATELVDEFDEEELEDVIAELRARNLDVFRARFLWGWYEGELDDLVLFQERRGVRPVERLWAYYLMGDGLWSELARDLG